jgi:uncharacterized protein
MGDPRSAEAEALVNEVVRTRWLPNVVLAVASPNDRDAAGSVALLADRGLVDGRPAAYVCQRFVCRLPVTEPSALISAFETLS